ncbi:ribonuclease E/G [Fusibacter paucivorans]|uniref:Ribonuclease E/G n=1 Tax=Fusibacter paucivorans TaxID=76009 RepID=A0ABS5PNS2_9FIRM|nr:ribonuclease E/G [Fusibacter paucivorans]MBS7526825.1 ribonuclease E/G [Fusibacter paucivorans]
MNNKNKAIYIVESRDTRLAIKYDLTNDAIEGIVASRGENYTYLNKVFAAKIVNIVDSLDGVFLDIGAKENAFMTKRELCKALDITYAKVKQVPIKQLVKRNQLILAQVSREAYQSKGASLKAEISIVGKYFVLLPQTKGIKYSRKINPRTLDLTLQNRLTEKGAAIGFIVRSQVAETNDTEAVYGDLMRLIDVWERMLNQFRLTPNMRCLYEPDTFEDEVYRRLYEMRQTRLYVQRDEERDALIAMGVQKNDIDKQIASDINTLTLLEKLKALLAGNVFKTPSGAQFTIDELEAFTIIDIDSATYTGDQTKDDFAFGLNLEAAKSIRQLLLLRQIAGVIIIDFIHMPAEVQTRFLEKCREEFFTRDDDFSVHGFTALGLLEITRKREKPSLKALMSFDYKCGDLYHLALVSMENQLRRLSNHTNTKRAMVVCEEPLYIYLRQRPIDGSIFGLSLKYEKRKRTASSYAIQTLPE